ncbi:MAG: glycogen synthase GlgA, partial [Burkholderiales bacterium]
VEDSVRDSVDGTGFTFYKPSASELFSAVQKAVRAYHDQSAWRRLQENGMRKDFGWEKSARAYQAIYRRLRARASDKVRA